jgi:hypothetical protein
MPKFEHIAIVLKLKEKGFALSRKELVQGIDEESVNQLTEFGAAGWEMVSAIPFASGGASMSFTGSAGKTDAVIAFLKRQCE